MSKQLTNCHKTQSTESHMTPQLDSSIIDMMNECRNQSVRKTEEEKLAMSNYKSEVEKNMYWLKVGTGHCFEAFFTYGSKFDFFKENKLWGTWQYSDYQVDMDLVNEKGEKHKPAERQLHYIDLMFSRCMQRAYIITAETDNNENFSFNTSTDSAQNKKATLVVGYSLRDYHCGMYHPYVITMVKLREIMADPSNKHVRRFTKNGVEIILVSKEAFDELPYFDRDTFEILDKKEIEKRLMMGTSKYTPPMSTANPLV